MLEPPTVELFLIPRKKRVLKLLLLPSFGRLLFFLWLYWYEPRSQVLFACFRNLFVNTRSAGGSFIRHGYAHRSLMGDISYAVFVDSHRIPSRLLFLCGFLYRDPAGTVLRLQQVYEGPAIPERGCCTYRCF